MLKDNPTSWTDAESLDEKTPTSMYWPGTSHAAPDQVDGLVARPARARRVDQAPVPSIVIAQEILLDGGYDGVADTVGMVRLRHSNALARALIVGLGGLFALTIGILLADFAHGRCSMQRRDLPQNAATGAPLGWTQDRSRALAPP